jgi:hypothetical protein
LHTAPRTGLASIFHLHPSSRPGIHVLFISVFNNGEPCVSGPLFLPTSSWRRARPPQAHWRTGRPSFPKVDWVVRACPRADWRGVHVLSVGLSVWLPCPQAGHDHVHLAALPARVSVHTHPHGATALSITGTHITCARMSKKKPCAVVQHLRELDTMFCQHRHGNRLQRWVGAPVSRPGPEVSMPCHAMHGPCRLCAGSTTACPTACLGGAAPGA